MNRSDMKAGALTAVAARDLDRLRQVLRAGANPNATTDGGLTALGQAVVQGDIEFVAALVDSGADVSRAGPGGHAPLHLASTWNEPQIARFLLARGADPNAPGRDGTTPLCLAIARKQLDLAACLLEYGADVRRACHDGTTALHLALAADYRDLAQALLARGADPEARDAAGRAAVDAASSADGVLLSLAADVAPDDLAATVAGQTALAAALHGELARGGGNVFFAPTSVATALAMSCAGAQGETAREMAAVLHFPPLDPARIHAACAAVAATAHRAPGVELSIANALFAQQGEHFLPDFVALLARCYRSELRELDFAKPGPASAAINDWVASRTGGLIKDLVSAEQLNELTRLVLANAIYFKGTWASRFKKELTRIDPFFHLDGTSTPARLMFRSGSYNLATVDGGQALELPYVGKAVSMVVILPSAIDGLPALEAKLSSSLQGWLDQLDEQTRHLPSEDFLPTVEVHLPRFSIDTTFELRDPLTALGMRLAFHPLRADFSAMHAGGPLYISAVCHKACVEVDEEGTTAAAATAVVHAAYGAGPPPPPVFRADHPFLFLIRDRRTKSILFLGRLITVPPMH